MKAFTHQGGTLIFLNESVRYAQRRLGIGVKDSVEGLGSGEFYSPGSLLNVSLQKHPLTYGLPMDLAMWSQGSPAWEVDVPAGSVSVARYPKSGILASGWLLGETYLSGLGQHSSEVSQGKGRVILFGMRPQYRAQSYQTFKLFFNALVRQ